MRTWAAVGLIVGVGCQRPEPGTSKDDEPADTSAPDTETTPSTTDTATAPTGDTGTPGTPGTTPTGLLYPPAPYDCGLGVPAGPPAVTWLPASIDVTEAIAFDLDGNLVAWDRQQNAVKYAVDGTPTLFTPAAGESRGIDVLPNGDILYTDGTATTVRALERATGNPYTVADLGQWAGYCDVDIAADGTVVTANLSGQPRILLPDGTVQDFGRTAVQLYGAALSVDEQTAYWSGYSISEPYLFRSTRQPDGTWSEPEPWVEIAVNSLSGVAVDACDNLYVVQSFGCQVFRVSPAGDVELLVDLQTGPASSCPNLAFGRGLGGWDAYTLYVSTYDDVVALDVGVPGRPR